ncbi:MAG: D-alanyl-lipoteichoic acid biosynthesis protein DltD [Bacteroidota bacterium]
MKNFLKYHLLPLILGLFIAFFVAIILVKSPLLLRKNEKTKEVSTTKKLNPNSCLATLVENEKQELELLASLQEKQGITLFGSSELSVDSRFIPFTYLPEKKGIRVNAFGHAFQQNFAIYCQLLALKKSLKNAKVCIILSASWFETEGTNMEAFLEFARPNFLKKIIRDQSISLDVKNYIGEYLFKNSDKIENSSQSINYFINLYKYKNIPFLNEYFFKKWKEFDKIAYKVNATYDKSVLADAVEIDWDKEMEFIQKEFTSKIKSNKIFVNDEYFNQYLKQEDGGFKKGNLLCLPKESNRELEDFKLLVQLLKQEKCKASFVIQSMNPHYYNKLESFNPVLEEIKKLLEKEKLPYLNLFTASKKKYEGGTLTDIMHFGDLGWLKVDEFLYKTYAK